MVVSKQDVNESSIVDYSEYLAREKAIDHLLSHCDKRIIQTYRIHDPFNTPQGIEEFYKNVIEKLIKKYQEAGWDVRCTERDAGWYCLIFL